MQATNSNSIDAAVVIKKKLLAELKAEVHRLIEEKAQGIPKGQEDIREMLAVYIKGDFISLLIRTGQQSKEEGFHCGSLFITEEELLKAIKFLKELDKEKILNWRKSQRPLAAALALGFAQSMKEKTRLEQLASQVHQRSSKKKTQKAATKSPKCDEDIEEKELELLRDSIMGRLEILDCEEKQKICCSSQVEKMSARPSNGSFFPLSVCCNTAAASAAVNSTLIVSQYQSQEKAKFIVTPYARAVQLIKEKNVVSGRDGIKIIDEAALNLLLIEQRQSQNYDIAHEIEEIIRLVRLENMERALVKEREAQRVLEIEQKKKEKEEVQKNLAMEQKQKEQCEVTKDHKEAVNLYRNHKRKQRAKQRRENASFFVPQQQKEQHDLLPSNSCITFFDEKNKAAFVPKLSDVSGLDEEMQLQIRLLYYFRLNDMDKLIEAMGKYAAKWPDRAIACKLGPLSLFCFPKEPSAGYRMPAELVKIILATIDSADPAIICSFGVNCVTGLGVEVNNAEGARLLKMAADRGDADAMYFYGYFFHYHGEQHGGKMDVNEAVKWFKKAADKGSVLSKYYLGLSYRYLGNDRAAFQYFSKACSEGNYEGCHFLGEYYSKGIIVKKNLEKAFDCFLLGANKGDFNAQYHAALCFLKGVGTKQDAVKAKDYFLRVYKTLEQDKIVAVRMAADIKRCLSLLYVREMPMEELDEIFLLEGAVELIFTQGTEAEEAKLHLKRLMEGEKKSLVVYCVAKYSFSNEIKKGEISNGIRLYIYAYLLGSDLALEKLMELKVAILNAMPKNQLISTSLTEVEEQVCLFKNLDLFIYHDSALKVCMDVHGLKFDICIVQSDQVARLQKLRKIFSDMFNPEYKIKNIVKCAMQGYFDSALLFLQSCLCDNNLGYEDLNKLKESIEFLEKKIKAAKGENQEIMEIFIELKLRFNALELAMASAAGFCQLMSGGVAFPQ